MEALLWSPHGGVEHVRGSPVIPGLWWYGRRIVRCPTETTSMSKAKPLSLAQQRVLNLAASRADRAVLPLSDDMPRRGAVPQRLIAALLAQRMIEERPASGDAAVWRRDADGTPYTLSLTQRGVAAADPVEQVIEDGACAAEGGAATEAAAPPAQEMQPPPPQVKVAPDTPPSAGKVPTGKLGQVVTAISSAPGVTLDELVGLTGWLPHTTRAALTRLRQRGYAITLSRTDGRNAYLLKAAEAAAMAPSS